MALMMRPYALSSGGCRSPYPYAVRCGKPRPSRPVPGARMPSTRPPLSRDRVVTEAMALADEQGLPALSMRALAGRLGVEAMSLYHHVPGKEALLDAMVDAVFGELHLPVVGGDWRAELRARSVSGRTVLLRHPWAVGLMDSRRTPGPQNLRHHDAVLGCLALQGFSLVAAGTAFALLDAHLYGFMQQEVSLPFAGEADLAALGAELMGPEVRATYPHFTAFAEGRALQPGYAFANEFGVTLDLVLGALEGLHSAGRGAAAPGGGGADHRAAGRDGARGPRRAGGGHRHPDRVAGQHDPTGRRAGP